MCGHPVGQGGSFNYMPIDASGTEEIYATFQCLAGGTHLMGVRVSRDKLCEQVETS